MKSYLPLVAEENRLSRQFFWAAEGQPRRRVAGGTIKVL
jgi:hypothetical protein